VRIGARCLRRPGLRKGAGTHPTHARTSGPGRSARRPEAPLPKASEPAVSPAAAQPGRSPHSEATRACACGLAEQPPASSPLQRYLLRSREATLRQSNRKQNSGYWRQISRPTSSRSRCFSFSPIVRTQGTISVCVAEAVLQVEAEVEATPINLPRLRPRRPGGHPHSRRPADRPPAAIAQSPAQGPAARARPPPPPPVTAGQGDCRTTCPRSSPLGGPARPAAPPSRAGSHAGLPRRARLHWLLASFGNRGVKLQHPVTFACIAEE
uniref:Uncharacterized protein n=1 Tax=Felis catus TaxID=9685 RepID=A0ABI7Y736_FELCA